MIKSKYKIGAMLWLTSLQYYLVQLAVAADWPKLHAYSWAHNTISDLANTSCGLYGSRQVCSPSHSLMSFSFIVLGITTIGGALLLRPLAKENQIARLGFSSMCLSGFGTILVGIFAENQVGSLHFLGAVTAFIFGNAAMILIGKGIAKLPSWLRIYSLTSGVFGLITSALFASKLYLGLGIGGMERVAAYPQSLWMIVMGCYILSLGSRVSKEEQPN